MKLTLTTLTLLAVALSATASPVPNAVGDPNAVVDIAATVSSLQAAFTAAGVTPKPVPGESVAQQNVMPTIFKAAQSSCDKGVDYSQGEVATVAMGVEDMAGVEFKSPQCGRCVSIKGPGGTITATVVSMCGKRCVPGTIQLNEKIAKKLNANENINYVMPVTWKFVDCGSGAALSASTNASASSSQGDVSSQSQTNTAFVDTTSDSEVTSGSLGGDTVLGGDLTGGIGTSDNSDTVATDDASLAGTTETSDSPLLGDDLNAPIPTTTGVDVGSLASNAEANTFDNTVNVDDASLAGTGTQPNVSVGGQGASLEVGPPSSTGDSTVQTSLESLGTALDNFKSIIMSALQNMSGAVSISNQ